MSERDNSNQGVLFPKWKDQHLHSTGKLDIEGKEDRIMVVEERLKKDGPLTKVLYKRIGVLFENKERESENSPHYSGPLDEHPNKRMAAWRNSNDDGKKWISIRVGNRQGDGGSSSDGSGQGEGSNPGTDGYPGDDIPF